MTYATSRCRECKAPIWFGRTAKDKRQPIDVQPTEDGNIVVDQVEIALDTLGGALDGARVRTLGADETVGRDVPRYTAHFATCKKRKLKGRRR